VNESLAIPRTYPHGVPCWIDTEQPDPAAAADFYGRVLGWRCEDTAPPGASGPYLVATLQGSAVAGLAPTADGGPARWTTSIAVDDVEAAAGRVARACTAASRAAEFSTDPDFRRRVAQLSEMDARAAGAPPSPAPEARDAARISS